MARDLDSSCGDYFRFRDLVECGETWRRIKVENLPSDAATWTAMEILCAEVLDRAVQEFGEVRLTYCFSGPRLYRMIPAGIAHRLDQHAGHERTRRGTPICSRLGIAADFRVPDLSSAELALWVAEHTAFDRLYFYGPERPIHVSVGPQDTRGVWSVGRDRNGHRVPRRSGVAQLRALCQPAR